MKARGRKLSPIDVAAVAVLAFTIQLSAQSSPAHRFHQYNLTQIGTFGGPWSSVATGPAGAILPNLLNASGAVAGDSETGITDPFSPNCVWSNCYLGYAWVFQNGTLTELGSLSPGYNSGAIGINDWGLVIGLSENGAIDPATGYPEYNAVTWTNGAITDLGTLGGSDSIAYAVNDSGDIVGVAGNDIPDQYASGLGPCTTQSCWPVATQLRAVLWRNGQVHDLGTLGTGNDAVAYFLNRSGQIAGVSYTNTTPNPTTGLPTQDPFMWERGHMTDMGSLGGTFGYVYWLNDHGQATGVSYLAGDQIRHAFLWSRGVLSDLGTLGGANSDGFQVNNASDVVGIANTASGDTHGFLWHHATKTMTDIPPLPGDDLSNALTFDNDGLVVGASCTNGCQGRVTAILWNDGAEVDLNALVTPPSDLHLFAPILISDNGVIYSWGLLPNGDLRVAVLTPTGDCDSDCEQRIKESENNPGVSQPANMGAPLPAFGKPAGAMRGPLGRQTVMPGQSQTGSALSSAGDSFEMLPEKLDTDLGSNHCQTLQSGGEWILTGLCTIHSFGNMCGARSSSNCPAGAKAIRPEGSGCGAPPPLAWIDAARGC